MEENKCHYHLQKRKKTELQKLQSNQLDFCIGQGLQTHSSGIFVNIWIGTLQLTGASMSLLLANWTRIMWHNHRTFYHLDYVAFYVVWDCDPVRYYFISFDRIASRVDSQNNVEIVYLDLSKGFDRWRMLINLIQSVPQRKV